MLKISAAPYQQQEQQKHNNLNKKNQNRARPSETLTPGIVLVLRELFRKIKREKRMKGLFKSKTKSPVEIVRLTRDLLILLQRTSNAADAASCSSSMSSLTLKESKREEKMAELNKLIRELKEILYGKGNLEPVAEACSQVATEIFREDTLRLLIMCVPKLNLEASKDATQIVQNLQRQQVQSRLIAAEYLEKNKDLMDILMSGYKDMSIAFHYGAMLKDCIRHQVIAKYVLESEQMKEFFDFLQIPNFDIATDAMTTFKELMTRHKSTVAEFLSNNYDWFFAEFNSKLLSSSNYVTRRQGVELLGDILLEKLNLAVMKRYISSKDNLIILMNLLRESSKNIQIEAYHVFKVFVANQNKPPEIVTILAANKSKLLRLLGDFKLDKEDEMFEEDKAKVVSEIAKL